MPCKFQSVLIKQDLMKKPNYTDGHWCIISNLKPIENFTLIFFAPLDDKLDNVECFLSTLIHVYKYVLSWMFAYFSCVFRTVLFIVNIYMANYRTESSQITHLFVCSVLIFLSILLWKFRFAFNYNQYLQFIRLHLYLDTPYNVLEYSSFRTFVLLHHTGPRFGINCILSYYVYKACSWMKPLE